MEVTNYYSVVYALTPYKTETGTRDDAVRVVMPTVSGVFIFGPYALFFILFVLAFGIQVVKRVIDRKRMFTAIGIAFVFASIPTVLFSLREGVHYTPQASISIAPRSVVVKPLSDRSVEVTWQTDGYVIGGLRYSPLPFADKRSRFMIADGGQKVRFHKVELTDLTHGTRYELEIVSGSLWYRDNGRYITFFVP